MQWLRLISFEQNAAKELVLKRQIGEIKSKFEEELLYNSYIKENDNVINSLTVFVVHCDIQLQYSKTCENGNCL